jgi:hypothetical protein
MAAAGVVAAGLAVGGYWVTRGDENANGTGDTVVPIPRPTTGDGLAARVPELGRDPAAGRDIAAALAGTDLSVSEKRKIAAALVAQAAPSRLGAMPAAGRMAVLARLGDIDAVLWLDPTWRRELEAAHRTLAALAATASRDSALLDGTMQAVLRRWQDGAGYVPRISYVVYVQTWGLDERQRDRLRRALVEGWGFNAPETQSYSHAARLAEVRYGGPAMRASAELLAAALNGQTTAQGEAAQARRIAEALKPLVRRRVKAVENELIAEGTVELWLDGSDPSRIETPTGPVIRAPTPGTTRLVP